MREVEWTRGKLNKETIYHSPVEMECKTWDVSPLPFEKPAGKQFLWWTWMYQLIQQGDMNIIEEIKLRDYAADSVNSKDHYLKVLWS